MPAVIVLDSFPLSSVAKTPGSRALPSMLDLCRNWITRRTLVGHSVVVPAICYYETLRELERQGAVSQIARPRRFCHAEPGRYLSLADADLDLAAQLWARSRNAGMPTAADHALDCDVILAAQALNMGIPATDFVVATTKPGHLSRFVPCKLWSEIEP
jgi:hypothetical protein